MNNKNYQESKMMEEKANSSIVHMTTAKQVKANKKDII